MRRYSPEEVALFISSCGDLTDEPESEIIDGLAAWAEHMRAGGFEVGFDLEDPDAGQKRLAFMAIQAREFEVWRDAVMAELERFGVANINEGGEHVRLHDAIAYWAEELAQLRLHDPDPAHAERALAERRQNWERWESPLEAPE
jgi:hypothetical protein